MYVTVFTLAFNSSGKGAHWRGHAYLGCGAYFFLGISVIQSRHKICNRGCHGQHHVLHYSKSICSKCLKADFIIYLFNQSGLVQCLKCHFCSWGGVVIGVASNVILENKNSTLVRMPIRKRQLLLKRLLN